MCAVNWFRQVLEMRNTLNSAKKICYLNLIFCEQRKKNSKQRSNMKKSLTSGLVLRLQFQLVKKIQKDMLNYAVDGNHYLCASSTPTKRLKGRNERILDTKQNVQKFCGTYIVQNEFLTKYLSHMKYSNIKQRNVNKRNVNSEKHKIRSHLISWLGQIDWWIPSAILNDNSIEVKKIGGFVPPTSLFDNYER